MTPQQASKCGNQEEVTMGCGGCCGNEEDSNKEIVEEDGGKGNGKGYDDKS
jgi:hypothetical protein